MKNTTTIKIPKKYEKMLEEVYKDSEGYWAYSKEGYHFEGMGGQCHTAREDSQHEILQMIRTLKPCNCSQCQENEYIKKGPA